MVSIARLTEGAPQTNVGPCGSVNRAIEKSGTIGIWGGTDITLNLESEAQGPGHGSLPTCSALSKLQDRFEVTSGFGLWGSLRTLPQALAREKVCSFPKQRFGACVH